MGGGSSVALANVITDDGVGYTIRYRTDDKNVSRQGSQPSTRLTAIAPRLNWLAKNLSSNHTELGDFDLGRTLGKGLMGTVRLAKTKEIKGYLAMKIISKSYIFKHKDERHINNERKIMMEINSSFCVKLFVTFQDQLNIYFAMEYVPGGELYQRLVKCEKLDPNDAQFYLWEIFSALQHLHSLGYVYRDLKPENVMIDAEGHCKLIDFGFSTRPDKQGLMRTALGTPQYLSPEQLNGKFTGGYTSVVDWWSLGIFLFELLTGRTPFSKSTKDTHHEVYLRILKGKGVPFPWNFDPLSKHFITELCQQDLTRRLCDPIHIIRHDYFARPAVQKKGAPTIGFNWDKVEDRLLVPPYVPRLYNEKEGDVKYFDSVYPDDPASLTIKNCFSMESRRSQASSNSSNSSKNTTTFEGF